MQPVRLLGRKGLMRLIQSSNFSTLIINAQRKVEKRVPNQCLLCSVDSESLICSICEIELTSFKLTHNGANLSLRPNIAKALPALQPYRLLAVGAHQWPLDYLIASMKYRDKPCYSLAAATLFYKKCVQHQAPDTMPEYIVATPIHFLKLWWRGFNQSARTAKYLGELANIPVLKGAVKKNKLLRPQVTKNAKSRRKLSHDTFSVSEQFAELRHIAIFDDVITTGTTVSALCRAIKHVNPNIRIEIWSVSISLPHQ